MQSNSNTVFPQTSVTGVHLILKPLLFHSKSNYSPEISTLCKSLSK